ncbi:ATP-binding protein [Duganella fentianensis]|uniref:ATP-binding protein n=1 Tax=Duganella fentianensis TaxID=2692177 RepID=UPI0032B1CAC7
MRVFLGSMTGRVFIVLLLGIVASAALTQWLAVGERTRAIERYRDFHALERAEQLITTADVLPAASRPTYLRVAGRGTIKLERTELAMAMALPQTDFSTALQQRVGSTILLGPLAERPAECDVPRKGRDFFAPTQWKGTCETMAVQLTDGEVMKLSVLPPRSPPAAQHSEWLALLPFLLSIAGLAYLVTRMTVRPLRTLAQAAKDLGNDINHPPVVLSGAAEIRQASAAFNAMQARIRQHIQQRTEMLAAITHDLQTPLTRMRLRLEKVRDEELQQRLIDDLSAMQQMVKEGLDLARSMDSSETMQALDLDALLDSVCSDATDVGQSVELRGRAGMALMGRPLAIRRCLMNLIDNAVKYGHYAHVSVERLVGAARIRIRDGGPGIDQDQMARVFEPFYRVESSRSRSSGGTGLGLTIARNIAEQHGGSVVLANHAEGGLEVTLVVPEYYAGR